MTASPSLLQLIHTKQTHFKPMIKQIASTAIALASITFAPLAAEAYSVGGECGNILGFEACVSLQDSNSPDIIQWSGPNGAERIEASCYSGGTNNWTSRGHNTQAQVQMVVNEFCRNIN